MAAGFHDHPPFLPFLGVGGLAPLVLSKDRVMEMGGRQYGPLWTKRRKQRKQMMRNMMM